MKRILAGILVLAVAAGCGTSAPSGGTGGTGGTGGIELAAATVPRLETTPDDAAHAGSAVNAFGLDLYQRLVAADPAGNLVFSPASIGLALAMARAGAKGQTAAEMDAVMHDLGAETSAEWVAALDASLNSKSTTMKDGMGQDQEVVLRSVNAPFAQRGLALQPAYLEALASRFGAGLRLVDYTRDTEGAREAINDWVSDQTEERIPELLAQGAVDPSTLLVLVNAIYLKAAWGTPFNEGLTNTAVFTRLDGSPMDVQMMQLSTGLPYAAGDGWRAVDLPYVGGGLSMLVIVPDDLAAFEVSFNATRLDGIVAGLESRQVALGLPRFGTETKVELAPVLATLGMPTAFGGGADFSGITTEASLLIDAVIHQANIDVDEKGTEAAAATAVVMRESAGPSGDVELTVDRPFIYALRDLETGAVLFLGRITEPAERTTE
jgi:serpin B